MWIELVNSICLTVNNLPDIVIMPVSFVCNIFHERRNKVTFDVFVYLGPVSIQVITSGIIIQIMLKRVSKVKTRTRRHKSVNN